MHWIAKRISFCRAWQYVAALAAVGVLCGGVRAAALTPAEKVSNAVHAVRLNLETALGVPVPSLSVLLETSNETFFASSAAAPGQALTPDTTFRFASNTKSFTAAAILRLHRQGLLDIQAKITDNIPGSAIPYVPADTNWNIPHKDEITIAQLLRHSAGVYDVDNDPVPGCGGAPYVTYRLDLEPEHQFTAAELVGRVALHAWVFAPDRNYHCSDTGYTILGEIIARVYSLYCGAPKTYSDYLHEQVVGVNAPVPLAAIRFPWLAADTALPEPSVPGVQYLPGGETLITSNANISANVAEGNGYGTLAALNRYIRTMMRGENILDAQMVRLMQTNTAPYNANYGCGCAFMLDIGYGHTGATLGYLSLMAYNPDTEVSVAVCLPFWDASRPESLNQCGTALSAAAINAVEALGYPKTPVLVPGATTNVNLAPGAVQRFALAARAGVYYRATAGDATANVSLGLAPAANPGAPAWSVNQLDWVCPATGAYFLSVVAPAATPCVLRLDTLAPAGPLVTVNGLAGDGVCLGAGEPLTLAVSMLNMDAYAGIPVDWWVAAYAHDAGLWLYCNDRLAWTPFDGNPANCRPAFQGPLQNLAPLALVQDLALAPGAYSIWFAVDYPMDGVLRLDGQVMLSRVTATVGR